MTARRIARLVIVSGLLLLRTSGRVSQYAQLIPGAVLSNAATHSVGGEAKKGYGPFSRRPLA